MVESFRDWTSCELVSLSVDAQRRSYVRDKVPLQEGVSPLLGLYMAAAGCPVLDKLKPMVRYHLPFASGWETTYRVLSMYLLAQYFLYKEGKQPDWDLDKLIKTYADIRVVNEYFSKRLHTVETKDASLNAVVILDMFADRVVFGVEEQYLKEIKKLFKAYF